MRYFDLLPSSIYRHLRYIATNWCERTAVSFRGLTVNDNSCAGVCVNDIIDYDDYIK